MSTSQSMILQSYQNKLIWKSESTVAQICQIWNATPGADVHVTKTFRFLSRNGSKDTEYSCSLIPVSNISLMQRVVTDLMLQNSPEYPVKHYSAFQGDSEDLCGSVLRHLSQFLVRMTKYFSLDDHLTFLLKLPSCSISLGDADCKLPGPLWPYISYALFCLGVLT